MAALTSQYLPAMQSLNNFYAMLYESMGTAMPDAFLSLTGAFVWRGYRIDSYKDLARCQYYCQFYHEMPAILIFQESYLYKGKYYHYDMGGNLNLLAENFFTKGHDEQLKFLTDFITLASNEAIIWQDSEQRKNIVPKSYLYGKKIIRHKFKGKISFGQVTEDLVQAFPMQDKFFEILEKSIIQASESLYSKKVDLRKNANWHNWDFRGFRMKFLNPQGGTSIGPSDYVWRIFYKESDILICERNNKYNFPPIPPFHLSPDFLSASEEEQLERLSQFALQSLQIR